MPGAGWSGFRRSSLICYVISAMRRRWTAITRGRLWQDGDWVFTSPVGKPLNPNSDYHRWKALLREAGVRDGRLHDARHTAATVLLVLGVPDQASSIEASKETPE